MVHDFEKAKQLQALIDGENLDVALVMSAENVFYTTGAMINSQRLIPERLAVAVWPSSGSPTFLVCDLEEQVAKRESWIEDIRLYHEFPRGPIPALVSILNERELKRCRIGIEARFMTKQFADQIANAMPKAQLVSCDKMFDTLRAEKISWEIQRLERVAHILEKAIMRAADVAKPGMREKEIGIRILTEAILEGETDFTLLGAYVASGPNTNITHYTVGDRPLEKGDLIRLGCRGIFQGYHAIVVRTGTVGPPNKDQQGIYRDLHAIHTEVIKQLKRGVMAREPYRLSEKMYDERGYRLQLPHVGHSVGLSLQERPKFHPYSEESIVDNMVCVLVHVINVPVGKFYLEDLVLVREGKVIELSRPSDVPNLLEISTR